MRPWMKMLAVGGICGVAIGVSLAAEKPTDRRASTTTKTIKNPRSGRLEFFSRAKSADDQADIAADSTDEELTEEVSSPPKRFTRSKNSTIDSLTPTRTSQRDLDADSSGDDSVAMPSVKSTLKPSRTSNASSGIGSGLKQSSLSAKSPTKKSVDDVEFVSAPDVDATDEAPITRSLAAKKSPAGTLSAGITAKPTTSKLKTLKPSELPQEDDSEGVVPADFQQKSNEKSKVQQIRAERTQIPSPVRGDEAADLAPAKPNRVSIINDRSPKPLSSSASRMSRPSASTDRSTSANGMASAGTPSVTVEWIKIGGINVGQECACDLVVKNTGKVPAREVVVEAFFPASVRLTRAEPQPAEVSDHLEWSIPVLAAGEERTIHISMIPSQRGELATTANVRFTGTAASVFKVEEPLLKVAVDAPREVVVGDPLVQTITLTNPGSGIAQNVKIHIAAPDGLECTRADQSQIDVGALSPGESRTVRLSFTAIAGGEQTLGVEATADSGLKQAAEATINVIAPSLNVTIEGPGLRYAGRDARYTLTILNEGKAATNNVRLTHRVPKGFKFVKADKGGTFDASAGSVNWFVGHLEPAQSAQVKLQLQANELGQFEHQVFASAEHGVSAKANTITKVEGSASLVMEVQDLDDPVEVGQETAYEVRISNTGSKAAQNVGLTFELPSGLELLNVQAATQHLAKSGLILFNDLPELAPGKTALFRIHVRGQSEGNQRVRARLTSESIDQELISEELTKFYAE